MHMSVPKRATGSKMQMQWPLLSNSVHIAYQRTPQPRTRNLPYTPLKPSSLHAARMSSKRSTIMHARGSHARSWGVMKLCTTPASALSSSSGAGCTDAFRPVTRASNWASASVTPWAVRKAERALPEQPCVKRADLIVRNWLAPTASSAICAARLVTGRHAIAATVSLTAASSAPCAATVPDSPSTCAWSCTDACATALSIMP
mmetsp:Transcript_20665/g.52459  ORF Transcript_20665/g.52459 Transcript_20665/m.52459 type:complete len:203 (-) Transcript_20665:572-1180(-)